MLQSVNLRDYMLHNPVKVRATDNVFDAMQVIIDNKISGVCVVDDDSNLVGILSELDCLRAVLGAIYNNSGIGNVAEHMASDNLVVAHPGRGHRRCGPGYAAEEQATAPGGGGRQTDWPDNLPPTAYGGQKVQEIGWSKRFSLPGTRPGVAPGLPASNAQIQLKYQIVLSATLPHNSYPTLKTPYTFPKKKTS